MIHSIHEDYQLRGWDFSEEKIEEAKKNNRLLMLDAETSNICNLSCSYCYRDEYGGHKRLEDEINLKRRERLIDEAWDLGCETIKIVGAGEPLIDPDFFKQVEYISERGITPIVYTNCQLITFM